MACKLALIRKFYFIYTEFFAFSEPHPNFRKAFDVHIDDLNKNAYDYLRLQNLVDELRLRKVASRTVDKKLMEAQKKLDNHLTKLHENDETISIEDLLK